jgi:hypothetical protein
MQSDHPDRNVVRRRHNFDRNPRGQQTDCCHGERGRETTRPMMDKDQNRVVSKDEFMQFIGQTFDRLEVNRTGTLAPRELQRTVMIAHSQKCAQ